MHVRLLPTALLLLLVLASIVRADPFNVDLRKAEARIAALKAQAKTRIDPNRSLDWRLPECNFAAIPLKDVLDFLHDTSGVEILTDWTARALHRVRAAPTIRLASGGGGRHDRVDTSPIDPPA